MCSRIASRLAPHSAAPASWRPWGSDSQAASWTADGGSGVRSCWGVAMSGRCAGEILAGRRVGIYIEEGAQLLFFDPETRELLRTRPNPLQPGEAAQLQRARSVGPGPRPPTEPIHGQRASNTGVIMVARQDVALPARTPATGRDRPGLREHPRQRATGRRRPSSSAATTTQAVHSIKDQRPRTADPSIRKARCRTSGGGDPSRVRCRNAYPRPRIGRRPQTHR